MMDQNTPLPFFIAYPEILGISKSGEELNEVDYMRQLYPMEAKEYLAVISRILDTLDFGESYIYDEYPDQLILFKLTEIILRQIPMRDNLSRDTQRTLVQILLYDEILYRRKRK